MKKCYIAGIVREEDGSGYSVYFPDVPNLCAGGSDVPEAIENAEEGLRAAFAGMAEDGIPFPEPSSLEEAKERVKEERRLDGLPFPEDSVFHSFPAPAIGTEQICWRIAVPADLLRQIDSKAVLAGMTRNQFLAAAAEAYPI